METKQFLILAAFILGTAFSNAQDVKVFNIDFNQNLNYHNEMYYDMDVKSVMKMEMTINYDYSLKSLSQSGEITKTAFSTSDFQLGMDMDMQGIKLAIDYNGQDVYATMNGNEFIDTENGLNEAQAGQFTQEFAGLLKDMQFDFNRKGEIIDFKGSVEATNYWESQIKNSIGFMGIVFSDKKIGINDSWNITVNINEMESIKLTAPLTMNAVFTRINDTTINGKTYNVFNKTATMGSSNLKGYLDNSPEPVDIANLSNKTLGKIIFDPDKMVIYSGEDIVELFFDITQEGQQVSAEMYIENYINLLDK